MTFDIRPVWHTLPRYYPVQLPCTPLCEEGRLAKTAKAATSPRITGASNNQPELCCRLRRLVLTRCSAYCSATPAASRQNRCFSSEKKNLELLLWSGLRITTDSHRRGRRQRRLQVDCRAICFRNRVFFEFFLQHCSNFIISHWPIQFRLFIHTQQVYIYIVVLPWSLYETKRSAVVEETTCRGQM